MKKYAIVPQTHSNTEPMDIQEVLQWADDQIFAQTGEHLDSLQAAILQGTWQRQTYPQIAKQYNCSEIHVKKEAAKLWHLLSDVLEEDINKRNFRARAERFQVSHISGDFVQICNGDINICGENIQNLDTTSPPSSQNSATITQTTKIDLRDAPEIFGFYNRTSELATLRQWILEYHSRIITIFGLSGIGKTALAFQLIQQIKDKFQYIIWRSLNEAPNLAELQANIMQFMNKNQTETGLDTQLETLIDYFRAYPCLVILDDVQMIFSKGELAGEYQPGWEDYGKFFKQISELSHQSCILLLSWEKPREIAAIEGENRPWKSLQLKGLDELGQQICQERGLAAPEKWPELMTVYQGNPLWVNIAATLIQDLFGGEVDNFLSYQPLILGDIEMILRRHWQRLSEVEKQVMLWLANQEEAVDIVHITSDLPCSKADFWPALQSLARRCLIEKVQRGERSVFSLPPVVKAYVQQKYTQVANS